MNSTIDRMLERYELKTKDDYLNALKEIVQEIALYALSLTDFFDHAAFYGGTALRIFYGLDRYSEDLDFSLMQKKEFDLRKYFKTLDDVFSSFGMKFKVEEKAKSSESTVKSAFLKGNTLEHMLMIDMSPELSRYIHKSETIKIKFEIDVSPPALASYEYKHRILPYPCKIRLYDKSSLFAGKLHAVIARKWKTRIKGRDFYDYIYYLSSEIKPNLAHLKERLVESGKWEKELPLTMEGLRQLILERFEEVDFDNAKKDVIGFVKNPKALEIWDKDFFISITEDYFSKIR